MNFTRNSLYNPNQSYTYTSYQFKYILNYSTKWKLNGNNCDLLYIEFELANFDECQNATNVSETRFYNVNDQIHNL